MSTRLERLWSMNTQMEGHERFYPEFEDFGQDLLTLLPFSDFTWSARCLDDITLNRQRQVTSEVMRALLTGEGWVDHPVMLMWYGHEGSLLAYQQALTYVWTVERGHTDTDHWWDITLAMYLDQYPDPSAIPLIPPVWLGDPDFHISHQSLLLQKSEEHYRPWFPGIRNTHIVVWPVL